MKKQIVLSLVKLMLGVAITLSTLQMSAQTNIAFGAGLLEQSRVLGVGVATSATVSQELGYHFGVSAIYTHGFLEEGYATLLLDDGTKLQQAPPGSKFNQYQLMLYYEAFTNDDKMVIRFNGGVALQNGEVYKTLGIDLVAFPLAKVYPYLSWSPVIREEFYSGFGWSHTVTINIAIRL